MKNEKQLRSREWFGGNDKMGFVHRSWMRNQGYPDDLFNRPVIGICNTWSELTPCNGHLREFAEIVKKGVLEAGGFPLEFPVMSLGETIMRPSTMLFRNLASMDVEESIRANPLDGIVLLTGCDKTTPSTVMGACSVGLPTIVVPGGPHAPGRLSGRFHRLWLFQLDYQGKAKNGWHHPRGTAPRRSMRRPQRWALQHNGHRLHHGHHGGSTRPDLARRFRYPSRGFQEKNNGLARWAANRRDGEGGFDFIKNIQTVKHLKTPSSSMRQWAVPPTSSSTYSPSLGASGWN